MEFTKYRAGAASIWSGRPDLDAAVLAAEPNHMSTSRPTQRVRCRRGVIAAPLRKSVDAAKIQLAAGAPARNDDLRNADPGIHTGIDTIRSRIQRIIRGKRNVNPVVAEPRLVDDVAADEGYFVQCQQLAPALAVIAESGKRVELCYRRLPSQIVTGGLQGMDGRGRSTFPECDCGFLWQASRFRAGLNQPDMGWPARRRTSAPDSLAHTPPARARDAQATRTSRSTRNAFEPPTISPVPNGSENGFRGHRLAAYTCDLPLASLRFIGPSGGTTSMRRTL